MALTTEQLEELDGQLGDLKEGLSSDGYDLTLAPGAGETMRVQISAREGACEDCLIPKSMFLDYVVSALDGQVPREQVELFYPGESVEKA